MIVSIKEWEHLIAGCVDGCTRTQRSRRIYPLLFVQRNKSIPPAEPLLSEAKTIIFPSMDKDVECEYVPLSLQKSWGFFRKSHVTRVSSRILYIQL